MTAQQTWHGSSNGVNSVRREPPSTGSGQASTTRFIPFVLSVAEAESKDERLRYGWLPAEGGRHDLRDQLDRAQDVLMRRIDRMHLHAPIGRARQSGVGL